MSTIGKSIAGIEERAAFFTELFDDPDPRVVDGSARDYLASLAARPAPKPVSITDDDDPVERHEFLPEHAHCEHVRDVHRRNSSLLGEPPGSLRDREREMRMLYYVGAAEIRTLAALAERIEACRMWD